METFDFFKSIKYFYSIKNIVKRKQKTLVPTKTSFVYNMFHLTASQNIQKVRQNAVNWLFECTFYNNSLIRTDPLLFFSLFVNTASSVKSIRNTHCYEEGTFKILIESHCSFWLFMLQYASSRSFCYSQNLTTDSLFNLSPVPATDMPFNLKLSVAHLLSITTTKISDTICLLWCL